MFKSPLQLSCDTEEGCLGLTWPWCYTKQLGIASHYMKCYPSSALHQRDMKEPFFKTSPQVLRLTLCCLVLEMC